MFSMETKTYNLYCIIVGSDNSKLAKPVPITWLELEIGDPAIGQTYQWYRPLTNIKNKSEKYVKVD